MVGATYDILSEGVKLVAVGLLGILWWDIRKIKGMRAGIIKEQDDKVATLFADNLTRDKHTDLCKITMLEITGAFNLKLDTVKDEILEEIRNGKQTT